MLSHRVAAKLRAQNWLGVALDFVVVVVGILIAFQLNRWYDTIRTRADEDANLTALAQDFAATHTSLEATIDTLGSMMDAASALRREGRKPASDMTAAELNALLRKLMQLPYPDVTTTTYENLVGSGEISNLSDRQLRRELTEFYTRLQLVNLIVQGQGTLYREKFEPYAIEHLDYALVIRPIAQPFLEQLGDAIEPDAILEDLRTREFQNLVVAKWQNAAALKAQLQGLLARATKIEGMLAVR